MKSQVAKFLSLTHLETSVAVLDPSGIIIAVNNVWKTFGRRNGLRIPNSAIGVDYLQFCQSGDSELRRFAQQLSALLRGQNDLLTLVYPCHSPTKERWFVLLAVPLSRGEAVGVALLHVNITELLLPSIYAQPPQSESKTNYNNYQAINKNVISTALKDTLQTLLSAQTSMRLTLPRRRLRPRSSAGRRIIENGLSAHAQLTKRQLQVLAMLGEGKSNKEIAEILTRSPNTVKLHVSAILRRLKFKNRTEAALFSSTLDRRNY